MAKSGCIHSSFSIVLIYAVLCCALRCCTLLCSSQEMGNSHNRARGSLAEQVHLCAEQSLARVEVVCGSKHAFFESLQEITNE
jgi:hypothetical protein